LSRPEKSWETFEKGENHVVNPIIKHPQVITTGYHTLSGWWFFDTTPLKNDGQLVSWDDEIPFPIFSWWSLVSWDDYSIPN